MSQTFLASEYPDAGPGAFFHILPVPLERTVSYGAGAANGPRAILEASQQLEDWDGKSRPGLLGFHTCGPVDCGRPLAEVFAETARCCGVCLDQGGVPAVLGGEHTVSYGALRAFAARNIPLGIVHIDAHADLRAIYEGDPFSHACVLRRAVEDFGFPLAQFATREYSREEAAFRKERGILSLDADELARGIPESPLPGDFPKDLYVTFDLDGFDASLMPATGTPAPGGLFWHEALRLLENCLAGRRLLGFDVVELAPIPGLHHADFTAARLVHSLMGLAQRCRGL